MYRYVFNASTHGTDPSGNIAPWVIGGGILVVGGIIRGAAAGPPDALDGCERIIPFWGPGAALGNHLREGEWGWAALNVVEIGADFLIVGAVVKGGKVAWAGGRAWMGRRAAQVGATGVALWQAFVNKLNEVVRSLEVFARELPRFPDQLNRDVNVAVLRANVGELIRNADGAAAHWGRPAVLAELQRQLNPLLNNPRLAWLAEQIKTDLEGFGWRWW